MCGNVVWGKHKITSEERIGRTERWGMEGERDSVKRKMRT